VVSAPGYTTYYLNVLAGSAQSLANQDDPRYKWVKESYKGVDPRLPLYTHAPKARLEEPSIVTRRNFSSFDANEALKKLRVEQLLRWEIDFDPIMSTPFFQQRMQRLRRFRKNNYAKQ